MNTELLYLKFDKKLEDGSVAYGAAFPSDNEQVILGTYTYEAKRMGGAPTITDTFNFPRCLDNEWKQEGCSEVYAEYNGEKFFVSSIPSPTKDNTSGLYKHEITLISRREILDNTLFFDVVTEHTDMLDKDRYRSNQTKFSFGGDIREFIKRVNDSLVYVGIYDPTKEEGKQGYHLVLKDGYGTDDVKEISIENQYITEVIQEIYNTFNLTYYWKGEVCYVGEYENDLTADKDIAEYGRNNQLLSVSEENTNNKIVDMVTGYGSSDNIPYYYPNDDEYGEAVFDVKNGNKEIVNVSLSKFLRKSNFGNTLSLLRGKSGNTYVGELDASSFGIARSTTPQNLTQADNPSFPTVEVGFGFEIYVYARKGEIIDFSSLTFNAEETSDNIKNNVKNRKPTHWNIFVFKGKELYKTIANEEVQDGQKCTYTFAEDGVFNIYVGFKFTYNSNVWRNSQGISMFVTAEHWNASINGNIKFSYSDMAEYIWKNDDSYIPYDEVGIDVSDIASASAVEFSYSFKKNVYRALPGTATLYIYIFDVSYDGDISDALAVSVTDRIWLDPSQNLMPSIYRNTQGAERFYYATDAPPKGYENIYKIPGTDKNYTFKNKYVKGNPHQGSVSFDDIKPTINGIRNDVIQEDGFGQLFGEIADVAFDSADSDVKDADGEYEHQYFYIKLHKFSGEFGFDLFNHALAKENAVINMIDCQGCPACAFPIKTVPNATKDKCFNCVNTDGSGNLVSLKTEKDDYILGDDAAIADKLNQNSQEKEIWIAVQKEDSTLGIVMPNAAGNFKPKKGDKFVITGIRPPKVLITAAEDRLDKALIKYMSENNEDQFNYTIKFSRIFLAENKEYADKLNENAKICVKFNGVKHELFVSNYSIKRDGNALADIEVELVKSLEVTQSEIKQMIDSVKGNIQSSLGGLNVGGNNSFNASAADKLYISKVKDDTAQGSITFEKLQHFLEGFTLGANGRFGINGNGEALLSLIQSIEFSEAAQSGFSISKTDSGRYKMLISMLEVWGKAIFHELEVRKLSYAGGNFIFSPAGSRLVRVIPAYKVSVDGEITWTTKQPTTASPIDGWKCFLLADDGSTATTNMWKKGDQARCETFNIKSGVYENVSNRYYWRLVEEVSTENEQLTDENGNVLYDGMGFAWVILSASDHDSMSDDAPLADDTLVCMGNRMDESRQNIIMISTDGESAPSIVGYKNISGYYLNEENRNHIIFQFNASQILLASNSLKYISYNGSQFSQTIYRGEWNSSDTYFYNDQVDHNGTLWQCTTGNSEGTKDEPSEDSTQWRAMTAIQKLKLLLTHDLYYGIRRGETHTVVCSVMRGDEDFTKLVKSWRVIRKTSDTLSDEAWALIDKVKNFAGSLAITWSNDGVDDDIGNSDKAEFTFYATLDSGDMLSKSISI